MITVKHFEGQEWLVTVKGARTTEHRVRVSEAEVKRFGGGRTVEELLRASFEFLLERESNNSILSSFELSVIGRYFPEYEREIVRYLDNRR
jgi:hypothetical protein